MTATPRSLSVTFAEQTTLPQLQLRDKKGSVQCSTYVNAFAVTQEQAWYSRPNGSGRSRELARGLWYLSLLGEPGTGTTLQALFGAATENNAAHRLFLEGIGEVILGNHHEELVSRGYSTHWNYTQQLVSITPPPAAPPQEPRSDPAKPKPLRGIHGILEPRLLSVADPVRAALVAPRRRANKGKGARARKQRDETVLSTGSADASDPETRQRAADQPCFLLLVPGSRHRDASFRSSLFLTFLSKRLSWPLKQEWAEPLWEACVGESMVQQLTVWSYGLSFPQSNEPAAALPPGHAPFLSDGYLCMPQTAYLAQVVEQLIHPSPEPLRSVA